MKKIILLITMLLLLTSCNKDCSEGEVYTDIEYMGAVNWAGCVTKETYLDMVRLRCMERQGYYDKCVQDFLDIKGIDLKFDRSCEEFNLKIQQEG